MTANNVPNQFAHKIRLRTKKSKKNYYQQVLLEP